MTDVKEWEFRSFNEKDEDIETFVKVCKEPKRTKLYKELCNKIDRNLIHGFEYYIKKQ